MLLKDFREPLLSFELIYFRNSFCHKAEVLNIKFWTMHVGPLWGKPHFFVSLRAAEVLEFSELSIYIEVVLLKTFLQCLELCLYCKY